MDSTPPVTTAIVGTPSFASTEKVFVTRDTSIELVAGDDHSGVAATYYRFDGEPVWRLYEGPLPLAGHGFGELLLRYCSEDNAGNQEEEKTLKLSLSGVEVESEFLNFPRVLVWTETPERTGGNDEPAHTLADVRLLLDEALPQPDHYYTLVTQKGDFLREFSSGIYNMVWVFRQDIPLDAVMLRELSEAVHRGMGLMVSLWGNSLPPLLRHVFRVDFKGSLAMGGPLQRSLILFPGPLSAGQTLVTAGKAFKVALDGGTLAGVFPGESICEGVRTLALSYPVQARSGDRVTAVLSSQRGKNSAPVDEEQMTVADLPDVPANRSLGNGYGDLSIASTSQEGITFAVIAPFGALEESYTLEVTVDRADGTRFESGPTVITPTCEAHLAAGVAIGPFRVTQVEEDRVRVSEDHPAVVLGRYREGKTVFLAYDIITSAMSENRAGHRGVLNQAAHYLQPETVEAEAGGVALLESRLRFFGSSPGILTSDTLGAGLRHLPIFGLNRQPLTYEFGPESGQEIAWRYFVRIPDKEGEYEKTTEVFLQLDGGYSLFDRALYRFSVGQDSRSLLQEALRWVEEQLDEKPNDTLSALKEALMNVASLAEVEPGATEQVIHAVVQAMNKARQIDGDSGYLRDLLAEYLRIKEGEGYFGE